MILIGSPVTGNPFQSPLKPGVRPEQLKPDVTFGPAGRSREK
jgi:hypothetical protein